MKGLKRISIFLVATAVETVLSWLSLVVTTDNELTVVSSWPDYDENTNAVAVEEISRRRKVVVLTNNTHREVSQAPWFHRTIPKWSVYAMYMYLRASRVYFTHGLYNCKNRNPEKITINLWHGMPIKRIGLLSDDKYRPINADYHIATSDFFAPIVARSFGVSEESVIVSGLPRCDVLEKKGPSLQRKILWLPTYRKANRGSEREDSSARVNESGILNVPWGDLDLVLEKHNWHLDIVLHPLETNTVPRQKLKSITIHQQNAESKFSVYEALNEASMLISDISSVIVDFVLTGRPICIYFPDEHEYTQRRGLNFNLEDMGLKIRRTFGELSEAIENPHWCLSHLGKIRELQKFEGSFSSRLVDTIEAIENAKDS
jgi:CDP-glycerol glycerophosphotransferase (TagB/SpsB family)